MSPQAAFVYMGGALGYALLATAIGMAGLWLAGRRSGWRHAVLGVAALFVVFLGLHPFPDPATVDCRDGGRPLRLQPFLFLDVYTAFRAEGRPLIDWLTARPIMAPLMNVALFMLPGAALALHTRRWGAALLLGLGLSLFNEIAQLTALWGIYPCRIRQFSVDDLILNPAGVLLGFALARLAARLAARLVAARRASPGRGR
jgi:hypothetical protein